MPKFLCCHLLLFFCAKSILIAQTNEDFTLFPRFAIIDDADGYTNVRDKHKNIIDKIHRNEIFVYSYMDEPIGKYQPIEWDFSSKNNAIKTGYIHESRIKYLYQLPLFERTITDNTAIFERDNIKITISIGVFNIDDKRIRKDPEYGYPLKIEGYDVWGSDCFSREYPERNTEIKSIKYTINGVTKQFEKKDILGYLFPCLNNSFVSIGNDNTLYIAMNNGDGAGSYSLLWILKKDKIIGKITYVGF